MSSHPIDSASPPCFAHELEDNLNEGKVDDSLWRTQQRQRLWSARKALSANQRKTFSRQIGQHLLALARQEIKACRLAAYWPIRGEPDLVDCLHELHDLGFEVLLPVVVEPDQPLIFRCWTPSIKLKAGIWNIPVPGEEQPEAIPDVVLMPLVGWDKKGYRLGNGGGFYDRTLATLAPRPKVLGVGYQSAELPSIRPQAHDIPCDLIVTENGPVAQDLGRLNKRVRS
ncbi:MAG: 5-formyltetrahydrofolate cyclo-ligase [Saccharospirillum sp.]|nr:5-formyltetrahydrofolate cyclo-ligase [Saccharospirillum sp.]